MRIFTLREKIAEVATLLAFVDGIDAIAEDQSIKQFLLANADMTKGVLKLVEIYQRKSSSLLDTPLFAMEDFSDRTQVAPVMHYVDISEIDALTGALSKQLKERLSLKDEGVTYHPALLNDYRLVSAWRLWAILRQQV